MKKKWYQSKLVWLSLIMALTGVTDLTTHWLSGQGVTNAQLQAIQTATPELFQGIKMAVVANNYFGIITAVGGFVGGIWRIWFTSKEIG